MTDVAIPSFVKDALEYVGKKAVAAEGAKGKLEVIQPPAEPKHVYLTVGPTGEFKRVEAAPGPREHSLKGIDELIAYANSEGSDTDSIVWCDRPAIVVVLDDNTRRDVATLKLDLTPQMQVLLKLEKERKNFTQKEFVRLLRIDLAGARTEETVLNWVREVRFSGQASATGMVRHTRESMGRDIEQEAVGVGECPEETVFNVRVFDDPTLRETWPVRCAVEVLVDEQAFRLVPLPLECHNAIEQELSAITARLRDEVKCPVFRGRP